MSIVQNGNGRDGDAYGHADSHTCEVLVEGEPDVKGHIDLSELVEYLRYLDTTQTLSGLIDGKYEVRTRMTYQLIGVGNNAKTIKGDGAEYLTAIKYMQPYKTMFKGKVHNICAMADVAGCSEPCLRWAGRGQMSSVQRGRERKTMWYLSDRVGFMDALVNDITVFRRRCIKNAVQPCVRPNGTSDIMYEKSGIMEKPDVQFYDYTKIVKRA